jgi:hypothetical protein
LVKETPLTYIPPKGDLRLIPESTFFHMASTHRCYLHHLLRELPAVFIDSEDSEYKPDPFMTEIALYAQTLALRVAFVRNWPGFSNIPRKVLLLIIASQYTQAGTGMACACAFFFKYFIKNSFECL